MLALVFVTLLTAHETPAFRPDKDPLFERSYHAAEIVPPRPLAGLRAQLIHGSANNFPPMVIHPVRGVATEWFKMGMVVTNREDDPVFTVNVTIVAAGSEDWDRLDYWVDSDNGFVAEVRVLRRGIPIQSPFMALETGLQIGNKKLLEKLSEWWKKEKERKERSCE